MTGPQGAAYGEPQSESPISRQIGPLKAWQWGVAIGGAILLYKVLRGGGTGGTSTAITPGFTPADGGVGSDGGVVTQPGTTTVIDHYIQPIIKKTLVYYKATVTYKIAVRDKNGKIVGSFAKGTHLILGTKVKLNGQWFYPILNMPGKYINASSKSITVTPVYTQTVTNPAPIAPASNIVGAPVTTPESISSVVTSITQATNPAPANLTISKEPISSFTLGVGTAPQPLSIPTSRSA